MGLLSVAKALVLLPFILNLVLAEALKGSSGSCSPTQRCVSGCCGKSGFCGFEPSFCDESNCISDCDRKAECGRKSNPDKGP
jgi:chitinase